LCRKEECFLLSEEDFLLKLPSDGLERMKGGYLQLT